jgi:stage II sporulation protein D
MKLHYGAIVLCCLAAGCADRDPVGVATTGHPQFAIPANWNERIRIGVVPTATSITLGSEGDYTIRGKATGAVLLAGSNGSATVTLTSPLVTKWYVQVACASAVQTLIDKAVSLGHPYTTEPCPFGTRLLLGNFLLSDPFTVRNNFRLLLLAQGFPSDLFPVTRTVSVATYRLQRGAQVVTTTDTVMVTSTTGIITINGATYRDAGIVRSNSAGSLAGINELHIEQYLYGVVPRELGPIAFPELEAQKAQAVAARTYALANLRKRATDHYDLLATTSDQVYGGYAAEHPVSTSAIDGTRGVALTFQGALINAMYSSTSGGHTADSEESFSAFVPYLRGVPDAERGQAFEHVSLDVFRAHANPRSLRAAKEGDFESDWASRHRWTFEWSADEISDVISAWRGMDVGTVQAINVLERGPSGRVLLIEYVTDAGTFTHTKDAIRSSLRFLSANGALNNLPSTLFFIEPVAARKADEAGGFVVYGGGFGHGVGMGQTGAVGMAEKGHDYEAILKHYYQGVELSHAY